MTDRERLIRWRLIMGADAEQGLGCGLDGAQARQDRALDYLYNREYRPGRNVRGTGGTGRSGGTSTQERSAGLGESVLSTPDWINEVHELFPKSTIERIEKDALERYHLDELVTNPELLQRVEPSE